MISSCLSWISSHHFLSSTFFVLSSSLSQLSRPAGATEEGEGVGDGDKAPVQQRQQQGLMGLSKEQRERLAVAVDTAILKAILQTSFSHCRRDLV